MCVCFVNLISSGVLTFAETKHPHFNSLSGFSMFSFFSFSRICTFSCTKFMTVYVVIFYLDLHMYEQ